MKVKLIVGLVGFMMSFYSFSQIKATTEDGKQVLLSENGTWTYSDSPQKISLPDLDDKSFNWKNGYDKVVPVKFVNMLGEKKIDKPLLDSFVMNSLSKAKYSLKNKLSFVPRELSIMLSDKGEYYITVKYLGKNSYGAESELKTLYTFDLEGKFISSFKL